MLEKIINTNIMRHPLNWLVVWSMILIAGFLFHLLSSYCCGKHPGASSVASAAGPGTSTDTTDPTATS